METRKAVVAHWMQTAEALDAQGEVALAGEVRYFATHLPPVLTDRERLAAEFMRHLKDHNAGPAAGKAPGREEDLAR